MKVLVLGIIMMTHALPAGANFLLQGDYRLPESGVRIPPAISSPPSSYRAQIGQMIFSDSSAENQPLIEPYNTLLGLPLNWKGMVFTSLPLPSQEKAADYIEELYYNLQGKTLEIGGRSYALKPKLVSLFNFGNNLNFYKGIHIPIFGGEDGIYIFPHVKENKLMIGLTAFSWDEGKVEEILTGVSVLKGVISQSLPAESLVSTVDLRGVIESYYRKAKILWEKISKIPREGGDLLVIQRTIEALAERGDGTVQEGAVNLELENIVPDFVKTLGLSFSRYAASYRSTLKFRTPQDFTYLKDIDFEFIIDDAILGNLGSISIVFTGRGGKKATLMLEKKDLAIEDMEGDKARVLKKIPWSVFQKEPGFVSEEVNLMGFTFNLQEGIQLRGTLSGTLEINRFAFSMERQEEADFLKLYQYKEAVLELFMRSYSLFNPLTKPSNDSYLTAMVMPAFKGKEKESFWEMCSRICWHINNIRFLSDKIGAVQHIPRPDMIRVKEFEDLLKGAGGVWQQELRSPDSVSELREKIWRSDGKRIRSMY